MTTYELLKRTAEIISPDNSVQIYDFWLNSLENWGLCLRTGCSNEALQDELCGALSMILVASDKPEFFENPDSNAKIKIGLIDVSDDDTYRREFRKNETTGYKYQIKVDLLNGTSETLYEN